MMYMCDLLNCCELISIHSHYEEVSNGPIYFLDLRRGNFPDKLKRI